MKIFNAIQTQKIDSITILEKRIPSIDLMETASNVFVDFFIKQVENDANVVIIAGPGNNGGDALAIGRLLKVKKYSIQIYLCHIGQQLSKDCQINLDRLDVFKDIKVIHIESGSEFPDIRKKIVIDGIFGSGLNRPIEGYWAKMITHINSNAAEIFSIDIPSGLFADKHTDGISVHATKTFSFEFPKLAFLLPQNHFRVGEWHVGSIGLSKTAQSELHTKYFYIDQELVETKMKTRHKFQHKGDFGHACLVGGSKGKTGAILLAAKACLRTGAGLVSLQVAEASSSSIQTNFPEAMISDVVGSNFIEYINHDSKFKAYGIGPGMGTHHRTKNSLVEFMKDCNSSLVLDADALNILSEIPDSLSILPSGSILTPHPKEFERLFGKTKNDFDKIEVLSKSAVQNDLVIVLKGAHSCVALPDGSLYFNSTGNPGMATAGSGDVLTGIITSFIAQGYSSEEASIMGVYIHGLAADLAIRNIHKHALIASDIIEYLSAAFFQIKPSS